MYASVNIVRLVCKFLCNVCVRFVEEVRVFLCILDFSLPFMCAEKCLCKNSDPRIRTFVIVMVSPAIVSRENKQIGNLKGEKHAQIETLVWE